MEARILKGTKREIAESLSRIEGDVHEVIVFVETGAQPAVNGHDIFAEMDPYVVRHHQVDDSRESIYQRKAGE